MDAASQARRQEKRKLLARLAELEVEEMAEQGVFLETPHYSIIERYAMTLGRKLSREAQERAAREVAANAPAEADCPACGATCRAQTKTRVAAGLDGPVELTETTARCDRCRRSFFPSARGDGTR
jgi:uncharacterized protein with PIN domain